MSALATDLDFKQLAKDIYDHGVTNLPNILPVRWADELDEDVGLQFIEGLKVEGGEGVAFRGWSRFYIELYPERLRGFIEMVTHPAIMELSREVLGEDYQIVEDRKSTRLNSSHGYISYAVFCLKKKNK